MKYLSLVWAQLFRSKTRTLLTLLSVVAAFLLFGMLDSVRVAFTAGGNVSGVDRLVVASRLSITQSLPISLESQISSVPGVRDVTSAMWFGGIYRDPKNFPQLLGRAQLLRRSQRIRAAQGPAQGLPDHAHRRHRRRAWPRPMAGRSATPSRCRPPSFRAVAATIGRCNWSASFA